MSHFSVQGNPFTSAETAALISIANGGGSGATVTTEVVDTSAGGTSFTISTALGELILFKNGQYQVAGGVNYTRSGTGIVTNNALFPGEQLVAVIITT